MSRSARGVKESIKATQVAFELEQRIARHIREIAAREGLTPSDQIRKMIGLSYAPPKRPRLTLSLRESDYKILGQRYNLEASDTLNIRRQLMNDLINLVQNQEGNFQ